MADGGQRGEGPDLGPDTDGDHPDTVITQTQLSSRRSYHPDIDSDHPDRGWKSLPFLSIHSNISPIRKANMSLPKQFSEDSCIVCVCVSVSNNHVQ